MTYVDQHWAHPWLAALGIAVILVHEVGLRRMNRRSTPAHVRRRRWAMLISYAGLGILILSVCSPFEFWSMEYFWVHMLQHIAVMIVAPALYVLGQPFPPLMNALPVTWRRRVLRSLFVGSRLRAPRALLRALLSPWVSVAIFNVVMVVWMIPSLFNPVMTSERLHISLMLSTFFVSGLLFWLQLIPSRPLRPRLAASGQVAAVFFSNVVMTVLAISISFFTAQSLYRMGTSLTSMVDMPGMAAPSTITLNPFTDQQIGAAILWVCGDFWAFPILIVALRRMMRDQGPKGFLNRATGREEMTTFRGIDLTG